ncbi:MAG: sensor histidine kinase, partial [Epsilonproteobacteria bacterium]|nr:sensor histidine kinase [Campylobacterota bacterium]
MLKSEKRSFKRFITLYIILITLIILMVDYIYYKSQEEIFRYKYKNILSNYASKITKEIKWLHYHFSSKNKYPRNKNFRSAIYDIEKNRIFSTLKNEYIDFNRTLYENSNYIYYQKRLDDYYLGAKYLFIEAKKDPSFINN